MHSLLVSVREQLERQLRNHPKDNGTFCLQKHIRLSVFKFEACQALDAFFVGICQRIIRETTENSPKDNDTFCPQKHIHLFVFKFEACQA